MKRDIVFIVLGLLLSTGYSSFLMGDNSHSTSDIEGLYICDYVFLPKNESLGRTKDVFLVDICSEKEVVVDKFVFYNIPSGNISRILYYPYTGNWSMTSPYVEVTNWKYSENALEINQPLRVLPSNHSNIFMIIYEGSTSYNFLPNNSLLLCVIGCVLAICMLIGLRNKF